MLIGVIARSVLVILTMQFGATQLDLNHGVVFITSLGTCVVIEVFVAIVAAWSRRGGKR